MSRMTKITEYLYIGNSQSARDEVLLKQHGITCCVNVAKDLNDPWIDGVRSYKIGLMDGESWDNTYGYTLAAQLVIYLINRMEKVLIHCHEGRSRSVAVAMLVMAYQSNRVRTSKVGKTTESGLYVEEWVDLSDNEGFLRYIYDRIKADRPEVHVKEGHWKSLAPSLVDLLGKDKE